jgi:sugar O-acyltransferase (sialic acid O-acetyltransferase NeuD family)
MNMSSPRVVIIGAGGNAKRIVDIFGQTETNLLGYISTEPKNMIIYGLPVLGNIDETEALKNKYQIDQAIVSIGDNFIRRRIADTVLNYGINLVNAIHPSAVISPTARIGKGSTIMAGAIIQADACVGDCCLVDTNSVVEHDSSIGDFSSVAPGSVLCGAVQVGQVSAIGAGAVVLEKRKIGDHCVIGAGSVVTHSVSDYKLVYGVPAKVIRDRTTGERYIL